jgi:hypothetical protein
MADTRIVGKKKMTSRSPGRVHLARKKKKKVKSAAKKTKAAQPAQPQPTTTSS